MEHLAWQRTVEQHREAVLCMVPPPAVVRRALDEALGLVLAVGATAPADLPGTRASAMDGFAVRHADLVQGGTLPVTLDVPAGARPGEGPGPGSAARIMTGAPVPTGADTVVAVEYTDIPRGPVPLPHQVRIHRVPPLGDAIRAAGSDVAAGSVVVAAGSVLDATAISALAATGHAEVSVRPAPRVRVVSTGAELRSPGQPLAAGQLHDSNSFLMAALARSLGHQVDRVSLQHDDAEALTAELPRLLHGTDILVFSGGASAGAFEVVRQALGGRGIGFGHVAMQPGKPQGLGVLDGVPVFCLPGNPVACAVSFLAFVRPWLDAAAGRGGQQHRVQLGQELGGKPGRTRFVGAVLREGRGVPAAARQSHQVTRLAGLDGFLVVPAERESVAAGEELGWLPLP
ncbi:gephyrin-like molybdotransferase Glp [Luteococcus peritonei]|uniref:Molybdopterin molybdenumtransferase n=1 Tax=Luteococcus peritonei TaxID=88874 RepID=A0ABW4RRK6_9ACTN